MWAIMNHHGTTYESYLSLLGIAWAAVVMLAIAPAMAEPPDHPLPMEIERAKHVTVGILRDDQDAQYQVGQARFSLRGTGISVGNGYVVTAQHAVMRTEAGTKVISRQITILTADLDELPALLTGMNAFADLAVYRVSGEAAQMEVATARFAEGEPEPGDEVFTVGYPLGRGPVVMFGRIGTLNTYLPTVESRLFQVDLSACSGNSGGGLFNVKGEIVGLVHAVILTETVQGQGGCSRFAFAVPAALVHRIMTALITGAQPSFSRLGIHLTAAKLGTRWRVAVADPVGPALEAGIRKGDILLSIENMEITDAAQLKTYLVERTMPGQRVAVRVLRGNTEHLLFVTLGTG